jgi:HlyD family secretion protein
MANGQELREQLQSLSIPREQRPGARAAPRGAGRSVLVSFLVLAVLALGGYVGWQKFSPQIEGLRGALTPAADVRLLKVTVERAAGGAAVLTATGKIVSDHQVQVATKVSGQIVELKFEQGDRLKAGDVVARIEDVAYRARRDEAVARLRMAAVNLVYQKFNFERIASLRQSQDAADIELAEARRALDAAEAEVKALEALLTAAQKMLTDCEVVAPIAGVVLERNVDVGDFVAAEGGRGAMANSQLAVIADMESLRVEVDVSELDVARLRQDMPCVVIPDAYKDRRYQGHIRWIDPGANYAKATVQVKVGIEHPDDYLRVQGAAQVQFLSSQPTTTAASQTSASIWIPQSACLPGTSPDIAKVFVASDNRLKATVVTLGRRQAPRVEVLAGLSEGQEIVAEGVEALRDGQTIRR